MLIRSQDKRIIINLQNTACIEIEPNFCVGKRYLIVANFPGKTGREIAAYSAEEKAIKVLDMIQETYIAEFEELREGVFQMPKDDEVTV